MAAVYILYSVQLDRYYIGSCKNLDERMDMHLQKAFPNSFTSKADDWSLFFSLQCVTITQARAIEAHLKRMRSRTYFQNLAKYPEMQERIFDRFK